MNQKLFTELRTLYSLSWGKCNIMRTRVRMRDLVEPEAMRHAVDMTMRRYPYFRVELKKDDEYYFAENDRPIVITNSLAGVDLNTPESNYHLVSFSWEDNWIIMDISHAITDGAGASEVMRTFLYYYVSSRYGVELEKEGIRLVGDVIGQEEWEDPLAKAQNLPTPPRTEMRDSLDVVKAAGLEDDRTPTVYSIAIAEDEFMRFNIEHDGSPATMVSTASTTGPTQSEPPFLRRSKAWAKFSTPLTTMAAPTILGSSDMTPLGAMNTTRPMIRHSMPMASEV